MTNYASIINVKKDNRKKNAPQQVSEFLMQVRWFIITIKPFSSLLIYVTASQNSKRNKCKANTLKKKIDAKELLGQPQCIIFWHSWSLIMNYSSTFFLHLVSIHLQALLTHWSLSVSTDNFLMFSRVTKGDQ